MKTLLKLALAAIALLTVTSAQAQYLRTSYFMSETPYRLNLNPALAPEKGFVNIPVIGHVNAAVNSNSLDYSDVIDIVKNSDESDYFTSNDFMNRLKATNNVGINMGTDIAAAGWWRGKNFWSFNIGLKVNGGASVPLELFTFLREMKGLETIDYSNYLRNIGKQELNVNAYTELAAGYARNINDRLSVGGRLKVLLGVGNMNLKVNNATIATKLQGVDPNTDWSKVTASDLSGVTGSASIDMDANLDYSFKGLDLISNSNGYVDDIKFESHDLGIAGGGVAIDAGVSYRVTPAVTLSAAILDLGFIKWSKNSTVTGTTQTKDAHYDSADGTLQEFAEIVGEGKALNYDLLKLEVSERGLKSRTTSLAASLVLGGDYAINDKLRVGALFTEHLSKPKSQTELTFSLNYHPAKHLDFALSYSPIMCGGKSFGFAMKLGPLFVGTDYMFLGRGTSCCNALFGITVPLGGRKSL